MPPLCKFFLRGECKNGDSCRFEHPREPQSYNRYSALQNDNNSTASGRSSNDDPLSSVKRETIIADLSTERPQWILSAYTPAPKAPAQLFGGPLREQSFEEMRMHHYKGVANGDVENARQQADALIRDAEIQMKNALNDVNGAVNFIRRAQNEHPNRIDVCEYYTKKLAQLLPGQLSPANSAPTANNRQPQAARTFGEPPSIGLKPNSFGVQSSFGQPSRLGPSTFGQPSALGQKPNTFGVIQGSTRSQGPAPFSSFTNVSNPFGGHSQPVTSSPFLQQSQSAQSNPFSQTAQTTGPNLFSQTTGPNPFSQKSTSPNENTFGRPEQAGPFGTLLPTTDFGRNEPPLKPFSSNPFGQPTAVPTANPFSQPSRVQGIQTANASAPIMKQPESAANGISVKGPYAPGATLEHPPLQSYSSKDPSQKLTVFKGKQVVYRDGEAGTQNRGELWEKIWFPNGPPVYYKATEMDNDVYTEDFKAAYLHLRETGEFQGGVMPLLPPKREWCLWDF